MILDVFSDLYDSQCILGFKKFSAVLGEKASPLLKGFSNVILIGNADSTYTAANKGYHLVAERSIAVYR